MQRHPIFSVEFTFRVSKGYGGRIDRWLIDRASRPVFSLFPTTEEQGRGDGDRERERENDDKSRDAFRKTIPSWLATLPTLRNNNLSPIIGTRSITHRRTLDLTRPPASLVANQRSILFLFTFAERARRDFFPIFIRPRFYTVYGTRTEDRIKPRLHRETFAY